MSEVMGLAVLCAELDEIKNAIAAIDEYANIEEFNNLFALLGLTEMSEGLDISIEEVGEKYGYTMLSLFGEGWVTVIRHLLPAKGLNLWAKLWDENGVDYYFALTAQHTIDKELALEAGNFSDQQIEVVVNSWKATMPDKVRTIFSS